MAVLAGVWQTLKAGLPTAIAALGIGTAAVMVFRWGLGMAEPTIKAGGFELRISWIMWIVIGIIAFIIIMKVLRR